MADKRPTELTTEETTFRGFVHSDDPTNGSRKFDLARIGQALAARLPATGYHFTGVNGTLGRATGVQIGTGDVFVRVRFQVPSSNPSATRGLFFLSSSATTASIGYAFSGFLTTSGLIYVYLTGALSTDIKQFFGSTSIVSSNGGQIVDLVVVRNSSTPSVSVYVNGSAYAGTESTSGASPPTWAGSITSTYFAVGERIGTNPFSGTMLSAEYGNVALSSLEVAILTRYGWAGLPQYVHAGGAGQVLYTSDFSATTDGWVSVTNGAVSVSSGNLLYTGGARRAERSLPDAVIGKTYLVDWTLVSVSNAVPIYIRLGQGSGSQGPDRTAGTYAERLTPTSTDTSLRIYNKSDAAADWAATGIRVTTVGLCGRWVFDRNTGYQVPDLSGGGRPLLLTAATGWLQSPSLDIPLNQAVTHGGSGNLQFGGQGVIDTTHAWAIDSLVVESTAAVTWSLGTASGGAQIISGKSLSIGRNYIADADFVTRFLTGANLWSNSSGAATITIRAKLRKV